MSLQHFFLSDQIVADETNDIFSLRLSAEDMKHAHVLRLKQGEHIAVVDAVNDYFECEIFSLDEREIRVRISQHLDLPKIFAHVTLVQGLAKSDKVDTVIRHATEIGVSAFVPFECERSIVKLDAKKAATRTKRWRAIVRSAAMQSGQTTIPKVHEIADMRSLLDMLAHFDRILICWEEAVRTYTLHAALADILDSDINADVPIECAVVVGPEGGLTQNEVDAMLACSEGSRLVSLGPSILRTETAGIIASALAIYEFGGLGNNR